MAISNKDDILKKGEKIAWLATIATILLAVFKALVGFFSGSILLIADAVHSAVDTVAIFSSWFGLKISQKNIRKNFLTVILKRKILQL
jgi:divalent metal cation (Fe/Co/Zn/Cd) transporter